MEGYLDRLEMGRVEGKRKKIEKEAMPEPVLGKMNSK